MSYNNSKIYNFITRHILTTYETDASIRVIGFFKQNFSIYAYVLVDDCLKCYIIDEYRSNENLYKEHFGNLENNYYSFVDYEEERYKGPYGKIYYILFKKDIGNLRHFIIINDDRTSIKNRAYKPQYFDEIYTIDYTFKNFELLDGI